MAWRTQATELRARVLNGRRFLSPSVTPEFQDCNFFTELQLLSDKKLHTILNQ